MYNKDKGKRGRVVAAVVCVLLLVLLVWLVVSMMMPKPKDTTHKTEYKTIVDTMPTPTEKVKKTVDDPLLIIVNKDNKVPSNWDVDLVALSGKNKVNKVAYSNLQKMMDKAREKGFDPIVCSSYRSKRRQRELYNETVEKYIAQGKSRKAAKRAAREWVSIPGTSEHQLGLAVDIVPVENQVLDTAQQFNPTQRWFMKNCYKYGFILRYPDGKKNVTGVGYEPWHYRYVGKKHAKAMKRLGLCLEEYIEYLENN